MTSAFPPTHNAYVLQRPNTGRKPVWKRRSIAGRGVFFFGEVMDGLRNYQFSLAALFVAVMAVGLSLGALLRTWPWLWAMSFVQLLLVIVSSAGLIAVMVLFFFFLRAQTQR